MLNLAIVGCGGMAHGHARTLRTIPDCKVVALCDIVPAQTKLYREQYFKDAAEFEDFHTMIQQIRLDGVVLVTPHTVHYPHAKAALEKGINVLCEKPLVTSSEHGYDLWRTVKRTGKLLAIAFQSPYSNEFQYLARERDAGQLGKVQMISGWMAQNWLKGTAGKWRQDPKQSGGGQMYDSGAHLLNAFMWLMNDPVVEAACFYDRCGSPVDINGVAIIRFQNGAIGSIAIGGNCPAFRTEIHIQTDKLLITTDQYGGKLEIAGERRMYPHVTIDERPSGGTPQLNFVNAILGKEKLVAPVRYGVLLSALMDAMYESADKQTPVKVRPVPMDV
jgi:predicted dehydrogenase